MQDESTTSSASSLTHAGIAKRYRFAIAGTLLFLLFENLFTVLEPYLLGRVIDGLIARDYAPLWLFLAASVAALLIGVVRRMYDTRVYGRIYREQAVETVEREQAAGGDVAQVAARVGFVSEFTDFFESMLPAALVSVCMLLGAVIMLGILSPLLCAATVGSALLIAAIFFFSRKRMEGWNRSLNDQLEQEVTILQGRQADAVAGHFQAIVRWRILLSDLEARNYGGVFLCTIGLTALGAWILIVLEQKTEGQVFAALTYVIQFTQSVVILPYTYQQYIRTSEISTRLADSGQKETPAE